ncbi:MAG: transposase [Rickettsia sp.]|nr:transposase [Rickettsia sp.]
MLKYRKKIFIGKVQKASKLYTLKTSISSNCRLIALGVDIDHTYYFRSISSKNFSSKIIDFSRDILLYNLVNNFLNSKKFLTNLELRPIVIIGYYKNISTQTITKYIQKYQNNSVSYLFYLKEIKIFLYS